ncbi:MAG: hydrogenase maturation nickel metallochaperone HypA [Clostridia bacterium]|nr:hydrogenase maturation nickel metallochaperone HypA [Clostridia bacterium]
MHELSVTQSILNIALSEGEKHNAKKITKIKIALGTVSGMVPDCVQEYFNIISEDTIAHKAELSFRKIPVTFRCSVCGAEFDVDKISFKCTLCGSNRVKMLTGREFYVESIDIDD